MRAMRVEGADPPLLVAEHDNLLAQQLFLPRKVVQFVGSADRLPVAAQEFTHRAAWLDAGQLVIGYGALPSIGRFHRVPPPSPGAAVAPCRRRACDVNRRTRYFQFRVTPEPDPTPQRKTLGPRDHGRPAARPSSIREIHPPAGAPDSPADAATRPPRKRGRIRGRGNRQRLPDPAIIRPDAAPIVRAGCLTGQASGRWRTHPPGAFALAGVLGRGYGATPLLSGDDRGDGSTEKPRGPR